MRFIVPVVGNVLSVKKDVFVNVVSERRNNVFLEHLISLKKDGCSDIVDEVSSGLGNSSRERIYLVKIPRGAELCVDRVYIRKGDGAVFNSVTLLSKKEFKHIAKGSRFFISVEDVEKIEFEYGRGEGELEPVVDLRYSHDLAHRSEYLKGDRFKNIYDEFFINYMSVDVGLYKSIDKKKLLSDAAIIRACGESCQSGLFKKDVDIRFDPNKQQKAFCDIVKSALDLLSNGDMDVKRHFSEFSEVLVFPNYIFDKNYSETLASWLFESIEKVNRSTGEIVIKMESFKFNNGAKTLFSGVNSIREKSIKYTIDIIREFSEKAKLNDINDNGKFAVFILFKYLMGMAHVLRNCYYSNSFIGYSDVSDEVVLNDVGFFIMNRKIVNLLVSTDKYSPIISLYHRINSDEPCDDKFVEELSSSMNRIVFDDGINCLDSYEKENTLPEDISEKIMDIFVLGKVAGRSILRDISFFSGGIGVSAGYKGSFEYELNMGFNKLKKSYFRC